MGCSIEYSRDQYFSFPPSGEVVELLVVVRLCEEQRCVVCGVALAGYMLACTSSSLLSYYSLAWSHLIVVLQSTSRPGLRQEEVELGRPGPDKATARNGAAV